MAEALTEKIHHTFGQGCLALALGLGAELGLFQLMADLDRPFTSEDLARAGGFRERYVREWLSAMASGEIVEYDKEKERFFVPRENMAVLTSEAPLGVGVISVLGQKQSLLKKCFKLDGPSGIDQSMTPDFGIWLDSIRGQTFGPAIDNIVLAVPDMETKLKSGICVADVGSGVGRMGMLIAERFPNCTVTALDIDSELLKVGQQRAKTMNLQNMHFQRTDILAVPETMAGKFDYIFCYDVIHDMPSPRKALEGIHRLLKTGGMLSVVEPSVHSELKDNIGHHGSTENYLMSLYLCLPHSLSSPGGEGWGRSMGEERARIFLKQVGFNDVTVLHDAMNHFMCKK